jgi:hypothetical protein
LRDRNGEDFLSSIDPAELEEVSLLIRRLERHHQGAQVKYEGISAAGGDRNQRFGAMKEKLRLFSGGFDDLKVMTDTLAAMNEALRSIVPVLPAYDGGPPTSNRPSRPFQATQPTSKLRIHNEEMQSQSSGVASSQEESLPAAEYLQQNSLSIATIWRLAVTALTKISIAKKERLLENSACRLKLWGV